jgi:hypothetical protein
MIKEVDVFGVYAPPLLLYAAIALVVWQVLRMALERAGAYDLVWRPAVFNLSLYVLLLAATVAMLK